MSLYGPSTTLWVCLGFSPFFHSLNQLGALAPLVVVNTAGCPLSQIFRDAWANRKLAMLAQEVCEAVQPYTHEVGGF